MELVKTVQWSNNCKNKPLPFPQTSKVFTIAERHLFGIILDTACGKKLGQTENFHSELRDSEKPVNVIVGAVHGCGPHSD